MDGNETAYGGSGKHPGLGGGGGAQTPMHGVAVSPYDHWGPGGSGGTSGPRLVADSEGDRLHGLQQNQIDLEACISFLTAVGLEPNPDAVEQLHLVFLKCLRIMCERPWSPDGSTWKKSGVLGVLTDVRKKFERLWERGWKHGKRHDDSALDLINYLGMYMRSEDNRWGAWGEPAGADEP